MKRNVAMRIGLLIAGFLLLSLPLAAQEPVPDEPEPTPFTVPSTADFIYDPPAIRGNRADLLRAAKYTIAGCSLYGYPTLVTDMPYAGWTKHRGTAEESIALIQIREANGTQRNATGLLIRCDGFILVPGWVAEAVRNESRVSVSVTQAEGEELSAPLPVVNRPQLPTARAPYGVLKLTGHHLRCLPLLSPGAIEPGTPVRLVSAQQSEADWQCQATSLPARVGSPGGQKDQWTLLPREGKAALEETATAPGTVVVDEKSGVALGIITQSGEQPVFSSFLFLDEVTPDAALIPSRAVWQEHQKQPAHLTVEQLAEMKPPSKSQEFVWVSGGPVRLSGSLAAHYRTFYKTDIVCVPGFFIRQNMVTVGEYRKWLRTRNRPNLPQGWDATNELQNETRASNLPVVGTTVKDAAFYANAQGGRLLTDVEWNRAAICREPQWVEQFYNLWCDRTMRYHMLWHELGSTRGHDQASSQDPTGKNSVDNNRNFQPIFALADLEKIGTLAIQGIYHITERYLPSVIAPIGVRKQDQSIFGARDVMTNAQEWVVPRRTGALKPHMASKAFPAMTDPHLTWLAFSWRIGAPPFKVSTLAEVLKDLQETRMPPMMQNTLFFQAMLASLGSTGGGGTALPVNVNQIGAAPTNGADERHLYIEMRRDNVTPIGFRFAR